MSARKTLPGRKASPLRPVVCSTTPDGQVHHWQAVEIRNGLPWQPYERHRSAFGTRPAPGDVERVCRWRRSLLAAVIVLEMAAGE